MVGGPFVKRTFCHYDLWNTKVSMHNPLCVNGHCRPEWQEAWTEMQSVHFGRRAHVNTCVLHRNTQIVTGVNYEVSIQLGVAVKRLRVCHFDWGWCFAEHRGQPHRASQHRGGPETGVNTSPVSFTCSQQHLKTR